MTTKIKYYKTNLGLFVDSWVGKGYFKPDDWKINGLPSANVIAGDPTGKWLFLPEVFEITSIERIGTPSKKLVSYRLRNERLANDDIPLVLLPGEGQVYHVAEYYDDDVECWCWKNYYDIRPLYDPVHEDVPAEWKPYPFELVLMREVVIESYNEPVSMQITMADSRGIWGDGKAKAVDLSAVVNYDELEKILTPEFLLHERPCSLTSEQVYRIVRHHVKNNIVAKYARITSDYDFCFTVKRKIAIKPYVHRTENRTPTGKKMSRPTFRTSTIEHKEVEIFAMTHAGQNYQGYVPIQGWQADNLTDMVYQIGFYLTELMNEINRPVAECSVCNGTGHVDHVVIGTNERNV